MEIVAFNQKELVEELKNLSTIKQTSFAAACAQRMFVTYERFFEKTKRGDPNLIAAHLAGLWSDLVGEVAPEEDIDGKTEYFVEIMERQNQGPGVLEQAGAENAVSALLYAFRSRHGNSAQEAAWAANCAYETLEDYIIRKRGLDINSQEVERKVTEDPIMQAELLRQRRDIRELVEGKVGIEQLRDRSRAEAEAYLPLDLE